MEFGLSFLPDSSQDWLTATEYFDNALLLCKHADQAGLSTIKMTEHYFHSYGGYCPSPLLFLANVASITKQIRLMTGCILPVFHHPLQISAEIALLDTLSHGRVDVGFARAYLPYEFSAFEIDMDTSRERFEDTISAVKKCWTEKATSYHSNFFKFDNITSLPTPIQQPHPPIWGAAVNSRQSFAWLGEQGFNLLVTPPLTKLHDLKDKLDIYRDAFIPNKNSIKPQIAISLPLFIHREQTEAENQGDYYLSEYMRVWASAADSWNTYSSSNYPGYTGMSHMLRQNSPQKMRDSNQAVVGTPEFVIEKLQEITHITQIDHILWQIDFGGQSLKTAMNTLELFVNEVMPFF